MSEGMRARNVVRWYLLLFVLANTRITCAANSPIATAPAPSPAGTNLGSSEPSSCGAIKLLIASLTSASADQPWLSTRGRGDAFLTFINQCNGTDLLLLSINVTAVPDITHVQLCQGSASNQTGRVVIDFERVLQLPQLRATRFASLAMLVNSSITAPIPNLPNSIFYDYYMVVLTPDFPKGAVRGQVFNFPVNGYFKVNEGEIFSQLAGGNILASAGAPQASGFFKMAFKDNKNGYVSISYSIILHEVPLAFAASIHEGEEGLNGPTVINFGEGQTFSRFGREGDTLLYGNMQINTSIAFRFYYSPSSFHILVQSAYFPTGAVRGQMVMPRPVRQNFTFVGSQKAAPSSGPHRTRPPRFLPILLALLLLAIFCKPLDGDLLH